VLLVDDDSDIREMYSEYLSWSGLNVTSEATGRKALESARAEPPDVVVTDIAMPEMDGLELSRRLREESSTRDIPIIAVSGQPPARARAAGADVVLAKPCEPERLLHVIEDVLKQHESRDDESR
jgi:CheY-like chemotaxis protein